jgi:ribosomal-protein-alanine N-acetyltransferase
MWTIREATADDLPTLAALDDELYPIEGGWSLDQFEEDFAKPNRCYLVATDKSAIVGYAAAAITDGVAELLMLTTLPDYRKQGMATEFWGILEAWIGNKTIVLQTRTDNQIIQDMYGKRGFVPTKILKDYYDDGVDAQEMVKAHSTES